VREFLVSDSDDKNKEHSGQKPSVNSCLYANDGNVPRTSRNGIHTWGLLILHQTSLYSFSSL